jgi:AcrR family transcriptional regulator
MRKIAEDVNIQPGSIYNHFKSKEEILSLILKKYDMYIGGSTFLMEKVDYLCGHPSLENFFSCLALEFPPGEEETYRKMLFIMLHEQHRNAAVREYVIEKFILRNEQYIRTIVDRLVEGGAIEPVDSDAMAKLHLSTVYYWSSANMMGIDATPEFCFKNDMSSMLYFIFSKNLKFRNARQRDCGHEDKQT